MRAVMTSPDLAALVTWSSSAISPPSETSVHTPRRPIAIRSSAAPVCARGRAPTGRGAPVRGPDAGADRAFPTRSFARRSVRDDSDDVVALALRPEVAGCDPLWAEAHVGREFIDLGGE